MNCQFCKKVKRWIAKRGCTHRQFLTEDITAESGSSCRLVMKKKCQDCGQVQIKPIIGKGFTDNQLKAIFEEWTARF